MDQLTVQQANDLLYIQRLVGCGESQVKANLMHYHGDKWAANISAVKDILCNVLED